MLQQAHLVATWTSSDRLKDSRAVVSYCQDALPLKRLSAAVPGVHIAGECHCYACSGNSLTRRY